MRSKRPFKSDLGRIMGIGATLMVLAYLLDSIINADLIGESVFRQILSPDARGLAVRMAYLSVLLLFIAYVCDLMLRRKCLEKALVKYQAAIDASVDGIFILNDRKECSYLNESHARLHGYDSHTEVQGRTWRLFYDDDEIERFEEEVFPVLFTKGEWRGEVTGRRKDGTTFPQEISFTSINRGNMVCIVRDITEHKMFEQELERRAEELSEANEELEAFGSSLTHDMRNYITRIYSAGQILQSNYQESLDEQGRFLVRMVCDANEEMERLITDMMVLSRIGRSEICRKKVNLSEMVHGILPQLKMTEPDRRALFDIAPGLSAECDPQLLKIALENLFWNAWKYTGRTEETRIEFGQTDQMGDRLFYIRDNGIGFDMKDADELFEPFRRLENANGFSGTGIGLTTVKRIFQRHGGGVWGEGKPGKGATFFFTVPE
ncbi:MAG: ATP-binding protein [Desulfuromonadales bacterium]